MTSDPSQPRAADEQGSFLETLRRRFWVPALCAAVAGLGTALLAGGRPHEYTAVALLQVNETDIVQKITAGVTQPPVPSGSVAAASDLPSDLVTTDVASQIRTYRTAERAVEFLQLKPFLSPNQVLAATSVSVNPTTGLVEIRASAPRANEAARIANAVGRGYVNLRAGFEIERIRSVRRRLERLATAQAGGQIPSNAFDIRSLIDAIQQLRLAAAEQPLEVRVLRAATPTSHPTGISPMLLGLMAAGLGFMVGVAMIGLREVTDRRIFSLAGVKRAFGGPVLCRLPSRALRRAGRSGDAGSPEAQASRLLLARLRADPRLPLARRMIAVGSPQDADDALALGWELAETAAAAGIRTLVVLAGGGNGSIAGHADGRLRPNRVDLGPDLHLDVVAAPTNGGGPASQDALELADIVRGTDGFVVVVIPPPPPPESFIPLLDGATAIAVCRRGATDRDAARRFRETLEGLDVQLAGVVAVGFGAERL